MVRPRKLFLQDVPLWPPEQAMPGRDSLPAFTGVLAGSLLGIAFWVTVLTLALMF